MSAPLSISPNTDTTISDSCNCASCISCCMPSLRGRRVRKAHAQRPEPITREVRTGSDVEVHTETTFKVHATSQPVLQPDGSWDVMIDGKKFTHSDK